MVTVYIPATMSQQAFVLIYEFGKELRPAAIQQMGLLVLLAATISAAASYPELF
jgi:hypothetical protein